MGIRGAAKTDTGKVRTMNEDAFGLFPEIAFYVVADGMGGHAGGEIASALAVETMQTSLETTKDEDLTPMVDNHGQTTVGGSRLLIAIEQANSKVFSLSRENPQLAGMGTTVAAILFDDQETRANICHVGDSRVYRVRDGLIQLLTEDHTLVQHLIRTGKLKPEERETFPHRHVLIQAVGIGPTVQSTIRVEKPQHGDVFLLCSDGVHAVVSESEMVATVSQSGQDLSRACDSLLKLVNDRGGPDNGTVVILQYDGKK